MKKRFVCVFLTICLLLLPGCQQNRENRVNMELFRKGFAQFQKLAVLHLRNEQYSGNSWADIKLLAVRNEWRNGEDFYWEDDHGDRHLYYDSVYWTIEPQHHTQWEQRKYPESFSTWWKNVEAVEFLAGTVTFKKEGGHIVLEQIKDLGSDNCTFSRQISTNTVYMGEDGEIDRITLTTVSYKGREVDPEKIHSVRKSEYYITPMDAKETEKQIQRQYQSVIE